MNMHRTSLFCLLAIVCSACSSRLGYVPTPSVGSPTATIIQSGPTRGPEIDSDIATTQANVTIENSQITWSGSISPAVFKQLMSQQSGTREAFSVPQSDEVFNLITRPMILAAYVYNVPSNEQRHARFLLYEPGGKWKDETVSPFLYKMDFPLSWIGGHEDYGNYDNLIRDLEAQFEHPILPNKLMVAIFAANHCTAAKDVYQKLCAELDRQGIELPIDYDAAQSMVMDQLDRAIQGTSEIEDVEQVTKQVKAAGTDWWEDDRFVLFYLPYVSVCLPGTPPLCGTYISYKMLIDTFGLTRATETTPTPISEIIPACTSANETETSSEGLAKARNILITFFELLNQREYEGATALFGGDYQGLRDWNPLIDPQDHVALLTNGCEINGLQRLRVKRIADEKVVSLAEYHFTVEFMNQDGSLFVRGPCCGGNATDFPPESQFAYTVIRNCAGEFLVLELPVYVP